MSDEYQIYQGNYFVSYKIANHHVIHLKQICCMPTVMEEKKLFKNI